MPSNNLPPAPPVMTWGKAAPVLIVAAIFDLVRAFFEMFWFFAPAIAALYCSIKASQYVGASFATTVCSGAAAVVGVGGVEFIGTFGIIMAIGVGLIGWLAVGLFIFFRNRRILVENPMRLMAFIGSLVASEIPLVGTLPAMSGVLIGMYRTQIRHDKAALKAYTERVAQTRAQEERRAMLEARMEQIQVAQQAANEAAYAQEEAETQGRQADVSTQREAAAANDNIVPFPGQQADTLPLEGTGPYAQGTQEAA